MNDKPIITPEELSKFGDGSLLHGLEKIAARSDVSQISQQEWEMIHVYFPGIVFSIKERDTLRAQLAEAQRCCAEMRAVLNDCNYHDISHDEKPSPDCDVCHALSSDCGKDYVPKAELDAALNRIKELESK